MLLRAIKYVMRGFLEHVWLKHVWFWHGDKIVIFLLVGVLLLLFGAIVRDAARGRSYRKIFMGECLADHRQYECDVMWGQANPPFLDRP